jgi:4-hydroxybenzoate polyprenyltransferase
VFRKISEIVLFGSIFIALCAVAMCIETNLLLHLPLNSTGFYLFVFGATIVQYNMHYLYKTTAVGGSRRLAWSLQNKPVHKILIVAGLAMIIYSLFGFHLRHFLILLVFGLMAFLYSFPFLPFAGRKRIKDYGLAKIITLALMWTLVTVWFPVDQASITGLSFQLIFIRRFIFIFILCLVFDIRDRQIDSEHNISTVAVKLGVKKTYHLCYILLGLFAALSVIQFIYYNDLVQLTAMLLSAAATIIPIEMSKKNNSDMLYLAGIDGMMLLQAFLVIFAELFIR